MALTPRPSLKTLFTSEAKTARNRAAAGMFLSSGDAGIAEIVAGAGMDYLLIDAEHSPLSLESVQAQLRAIAAYDSIPVVRIPENNTTLIKQYLDLGAQSLIIPMIFTPDDARTAAAAVAYPPEGVRGIGSALARSGAWGRYPDYLTTARETITLTIQIETAEALENLDEILAVKGIDGIFIGPSDLSASMGYTGQQNHPDVVAAAKNVIAKATAAGLFAGVNAFNPDQAQDYVDAGADFVNVGADVALLARATEQLAAKWTTVETATTSY
ncbi:HpcH/HpaI aldolase family protein [Enteractinococcus helveticum]|uniref:2-dehydro-3-deoxyglucarate aldolase n=1 Tax=Enteractinococcus helveticum TaxID=1837282 RepID=A0A1B7M001_9MICC|nr:HpcH/HpaI aldolase/citrate lyase family protein [Enteractinococcus helveticum]OAV61237.1 2-dehydro-3-deoxyglucarate aldolase [Enteractinococcus helveticum]